MLLNMFHIKNYSSHWVKQKIYPNIYFGKLTKFKYCFPPNFYDIFNICILGGIEKNELTLFPPPPTIFVFKNFMWEKVFLKYLHVGYLLGIK